MPAASILHAGRFEATCLLLCLAMFGQASDAVAQKKTYDPQRRWGPAIAAFESADAKDPPPAEGVLFVGSSSIRLWDLPKSFPDLPVINRGFGGSEVADSLHFAEQLILKHRPRVIVVYAGDNDVAKGKSPEEVAADYRALVEKVHARLPRARMIYICIKPSILRWKLVEKMRDANARIRALSAEDERLAYADIDTPMLGPDGRPRRELLIIDGLHLSKEGYRTWTAVVRPLIDVALKASATEE